MLTEVKSNLVAMLDDLSGSASVRVSELEKEIYTHDKKSFALLLRPVDTSLGTTGPYLL